MKIFEHQIKDPSGLHARPAGMLVKEASSFSSEITIEANDKKADAKKIFSLMSLNIRYGQTITVSVSGSDEELAANSLKKFLENNI